jgi:hypothetical protein
MIYPRPIKLAKSQKCQGQFNKYSNFMSCQNTRLEFSIKHLSTINFFLILTNVHLQENVALGYHPVKSKSIKSRYVPLSSSV